MPADVVFHPKCCWEGEQLIITLGLLVPTSTLNPEQQIVIVFHFVLCLWAHLSQYPRWLLPWYCICLHPWALPIASGGELVN